VFGQPAVTEVYPAAGPADGGTGVLVLGHNLRDVVSVTFGGVPATDVFEVDADAVFATTPPHAAGPVNVILTTATGASRVIHAYSYKADPTVTSLTSSVNPSGPGQSVTFTATVRANNDPASGSVVFRNGTQALATVPLSGGVATYATNALPVGFHQIRAFFVRNGAFNRSSGGVRQRVK
jgi:Bacterial Ig-like domain (group 3)/IPT/TIG domain